MHFLYIAGDDRAGCMALLRSQQAAPRIPVVLGPARIKKNSLLVAISGTQNAATRTEVVTLLQANFDSLAADFHVASLTLFGSYARDEQTPQSDVDLLVTFSRPVGFGFMHLADRLEALLGKPVDLVAADGIKPNRRDSIHASLIHVAP